MAQKGAFRCRLQALEISLGYLGPSPGRSGVVGLDDLIHIVYVSRRSCELDDQALMDLQACCIERNEELGLSGAMILGRDSYFQVLEGPDEQVTAMFEQIKKDSRHHDIKVLSETYIATQSFEGWAMKFHDGRQRPNLADGYAYEAMCESSRQEVNKATFNLLRL